MENELPESEVRIKISTCPKCEGGVTFAVEHKMSKEMKKEFVKDVMDYNLNVKSIPLIEYRKGHKWCECEVAKKNKTK